MTDDREAAGMAANLRPGAIVQVVPDPSRLAGGWEECLVVVRAAQSDGTIQGYARVPGGDRAAEITLKREDYEAVGANAIWKE